MLIFWRERDREKIKYHPIHVIYTADYETMLFLARFEIDNCKFKKYII